MFKDPVFRALKEYKDKLTYDVIRHEYVLIAEIARCKQYRERTKVPGLVDAVIIGLEESLLQIKALQRAYLAMRFREYVRSVPFWKRRLVRSDPTGWKYVYYMEQRNQAVEEVLAVIASTKTTTPTKTQKPPIEGKLK